MNKTVFGVLTILFNQIGVPCFIAGNVKAGIIRIVLAIVTLNIIGFINFIMGVIQGIKVLQMTDAEFDAANKLDLLSGIPSGKPQA